MVHESRLIQLFIHESCLNIKIVSSGHEKILLYFLKLPILLYFLKLPSYAAILVPPINLSILIFHSIPFPHNFALILFPRITHCRFNSWICEIWEKLLQSHGNNRALLNHGPIKGFRGTEYTLGRPMRTQRKKTSQTE